MLMLITSSEMRTKGIASLKPFLENPLGQNRDKEKEYNSLARLCVSQTYGGGDMSPGCHTDSPISSLEISLADITDRVVVA